MQLRVLSGGAAHGLVSVLAPGFKADAGCEIDGTYGAVGAMRDKLIAGAPADLVILTSDLIAGLTGSGHVADGSARDIGVVRTGLAVRAGDPLPPVGDAAALRATLLASDAVYFADPKLATAGIHFAKVLDLLGIAGLIAGRLRPHANGLAAMRALAQDRGKGAIGCTQVTEIVGVPGVALAGTLPKEFELATVYTAGVSARAALPEAAAKLATLLSGEAARGARERAGFEPLSQMGRVG
jgi:molybdate transport system substrate-binding protein